MEAFIDKVIKDVIARDIDLEQCTFILPSRRASVFLSQAIANNIDGPIISPEIFSIESFVETISGLQSIPSTKLLFEFYSVYLKCTPETEIQSFESFMSWAPMILQDFNEIDRYLVDPKAILNYLSAIKDLDHWSLNPDKDSLIHNHVAFWNRLYTYYIELNSALGERQLCYQGMAYRAAIENLQVYIESNLIKPHILLGFNALNTAESLIIQELLQTGIAHIYWDTDAHFHNNTQHSAGLFTRKFSRTWPYFKQHPFNWLSTDYTQAKTITVRGIPKQVGQAKYVGQVLEELHENQTDFSKVAVVLGDEALTLPIINSIPKAISSVNLTMGLPLNQTPLSSLFNLIFKIHKSTARGFYFKDVISILSHPSLSPTINGGVLIKHIHLANKVEINCNWLKRHTTDDHKLLDLVFGQWNKGPEKAIQAFQELIQHIKLYYTQEPEFHRLDLEYLYKFYALFNNLSDLVQEYHHVNSLEALHRVYQELIASETIDFQGEPLSGLQIMGMLESRVLDFETIILTSVNEGVLPAGKTQNSIIPFDVKIEYGLPTYTDKDAVYTHHFYRLLQRAKQIILIYNTETDGLKGGEKSRFINQLLVEGVHAIDHQVLSPDLVINTPELKTITKTEEIVSTIFQQAASGFSPSALGSYIRNPMDYYYQYVLKIKELDSVEEHIAANTLGSILHESLELLYTPFIGANLEVTELTKAKLKIPDLVEQKFNSFYGEGNFNSGKNLIAFEVAKQYLNNVINLEIESLKKGDQIKIIALEHNAKVPIAFKELDQPVYLKGTVDRIDSINDQLRIIDYKSGRVESKDLSIYDWDQLITDYNKSKALQLLCYSYIYWKSTGKMPDRAAIISFKNLNSGTLYVGTKPTKFSKQLNTQINTDLLLEFESYLKILVLEIFDLEQSFIEKELK